MLLLALGILLGMALGAYSTRQWLRHGFRLTSPAGLAAFIWSAVWLVHLLDLFAYFPLSDAAVFYSLLAVVSLFAGERLGMRLQVAPARRWIEPTRLARVLVASGVMALFFGLAAFVSVFMLFGNPLAGEVGPELKLARTELGLQMFRGSPLFALVQFFSLSRCLVYLGLFSFVALWRVHPRAALVVGLLQVTAGVLMDVSWGSRTILLDLGILSFVALAMSRQAAASHGTGRARAGQKARKWMASIVVVAVALIAADQITQATRPGREGQIAGIAVPYSLQQVAVYFTASLVLFDQTLDENEVRTHGLMSGAGLLNAAYLLRLYRNDDLIVYDVLERWEMDYPTFGIGTDQTQGNTYTWLRYLYTDFGVPGLIVVPFLFGFAGGRSARGFAAAADRQGYMESVVLGLCFYCAARSPVTLGVRPDYVVLAIVLAYAVRALCSKKGRSATLSVQVAEANGALPSMNSIRSSGS
jgi:oligosaccharide repeat unit polymerase